MKRFLQQQGGMALVFTGAILLLVSFLTGWTRYNSVLLLSLLLIILGIVVHVRQIKRQGKY
jgi:hypothetical protein